MSTIQWYPGVTMDAIEQMVIEAALAYFSGNKTAAANALGIGVRTIHTKLEKYAADSAKVVSAVDKDAADRVDFLRRCRYGTAQSGPGQHTTAEDILELDSHKQAVASHQKAAERADQVAAEIHDARERKGHIDGNMPARNGPPVDARTQPKAATR